MLYQSRICTSTGVPRKSQMYVHAAPETSGFGDSRITASSTPRAIPITIDAAVSSSVTTRPSRIRGEANQWAISPHWKRGFDASESTSATAR